MIAQIEAVWSDSYSTSIVVGIGDDCAVARLGRGEELLLTTDQLIENQHFVRGKHPVEALGWKALSRSVSDIAAMGGRPLYWLLALGLPDWATGRWLNQFMRGARSAANFLELDDFTLAGGDVARSERFSATITVAGSIPRGRAIQRSGARPGDRLFVSGPLGGSILGLRQVLAGTLDLRNRAVRRHCRPLARVGLGHQLLELGATAAIDLSDGLSTDAHRLAVASEVALEIDASQVPLFAGASLDDALASGEEYELLFTLPAGVKAPGGTVQIGRVDRVNRAKNESGVWLVAETTTGSTTRVPLESSGFVHFKK